MSATLIYVHDPMCSWCWAFRESYMAVVSNLSDDVTLKRLLGGLAPDTHEDMPEAMRKYITGQWQQIQQTVPGVEFNYDFWEKCRPRRATYPACRAVIAARKQGEEFDEKMTLAIEQGYYLQARNPSDHEVLIAFAGELGLDEQIFASDLNSSETDAELEDEILYARQLGVNSFPSMVLKLSDEIIRIPINYTDSISILDSINQYLADS